MQRPRSPREHVLAWTRPVRTPLLPELLLQLATPETPLWSEGEAWLAEVGLELPYWAFAWAGGQGLARHVLDHPELVAGRRVMDFACGSGLVGLAAGRAGAAGVLAVDIDPVAVESARINAALNGLDLQGVDRDIIGQPVEVDLVLAGDICYDGEWTGAVLDWLRGLGCPVLLGDPGRPYLPREGLVQLDAIDVPTEPYVEGAGLRRVGIYLLSPPAG